jgi:hypothetical protein
MSQSNGNNGQKFTAQELRPKWSVKINHTPNQGREYFTVSYYDENRKRQRRLYSDLVTAQKEAEKLRERMDRGLMPGLLLNGVERLVYERALEAAKPTGLDLDILVKEAAAARSLLKDASLLDAARYHAEHQAKVVRRTVAEVVQELVSDRVKNGRSSSYVRDLRTRLGNFAEAFKCPISSVTPENIESYLDSTGARGHYRKNLRDAFGTLFNFARSRKYVPKDHPGVAPITKPSILPREVQVFAPASFEKLLNRVPSRLVPPLALGGFTAIRTAEIERLDWSRIKLAEGYIEIPARNAKKKVRRIVMIPANLKLWLAPFKKKSGPVAPYKILSNQWGKFANRAGVKWSRNILRDSGISYRVAETGNVNQVALESGNSPGIILSNYLKCVTPSEAKKWFTIKPPKGIEAAAKQAKRRKPSPKPQRP